MLNPVMAHDDAAAFVEEYGLERLLREWRTRTDARLSRHRKGSAPDSTGAGRGTRRGRDEYDEHGAGDQSSARRRR